MRMEKPKHAKLLKVEQSYVYKLLSRFSMNWDEFGIFGKMVIVLIFIFFGYMIYSNYFEVSNQITTLENMDKKINRLLLIQIIIFCLLFYKLK